MREYVCINPSPLSSYLITINQTNPIKLRNPKLSHISPHLKIKPTYKQKPNCKRARQVLITFTANQKPQKASSVFILIHTRTNSISDQPTSSWSDRRTAPDPSRPCGRCSCVCRLLSGRPTAEVVHSNNNLSFPCPKLVLPQPRLLRLLTIEQEHPQINTHKMNNLHKGCLTDWLASRFIINIPNTNNRDQMNSALPQSQREWPN